MKYRIHFEPKDGRWYVQFSKPVLGWASVHADLPVSPETSATERKPVTFATFDLAAEYVEERGIDKHYDRAGSRSVLASIAAPAATPEQALVLEMRALASSMRELVEKMRGQA